MRELDPLATASVTFTALAWATMLGMELVRSAVDARRRRATGVGGTQDIVIGGLVITGILLAGALATGIAWAVARWMSV